MPVRPSGFLKVLSGASVAGLRRSLWVCTPAPKVHHIVLGRPAALLEHVKGSPCCGGPLWVIIKSGHLIKEGGHPLKQLVGPRLGFALDQRDNKSHRMFEAAGRSISDMSCGKTEIFPSPQKTSPVLELWVQEVTSPLRVLSWQFRTQTLQRLSLWCFQVQIVCTPCSNCV